MDAVVYLALAVLAAVFLFSLFILISMCRRRSRYMALANSTSSITDDRMQFSKLQQTEQMIDNVLQLNPQLAKLVESGRLSLDRPGHIEHCLAILRQCHEVSGELCALWLRQPPGEGMGEHLRNATRRVMPRVDDLLRAFGEPLEPRLLEARAAALVSALVALVLVYRIAYKQNELLAMSLHAMDSHLAALRHLVDTDQKMNMEQSIAVDDNVEIVAVQVHDDCPADPASVTNPLISHSSGTDSPSS